MTPARLYILALLCLLLAVILLFWGPDTALSNGLGAAATFLALLSYLLGLYLNRLGRRGEEALTALRSRIASVSEEGIRGEHRVYHLEGMDELQTGGLLVFYELEKGWLLVPLLEELAWFKVKSEDMGEATLERSERGLNLLVSATDENGRRFDLRLASTLVDARVANPDHAKDLAALEAALGGRD